jgi:hypothetical protein
MGKDELMYLMVRVGTLAMALSACGGAVEVSDRSDAGEICFPALTDCKGPNGCQQGEVCVPACTVRALCLLPGDAGVGQVGEDGTCEEVVCG